MQRLQKLYREEIRPALVKEFEYRSSMEAPRLQKIVVNVGVGEALENAKALDHVVQDITTITGQRPVITRARKSIAGFKLREGRAIGVKVTLRGERMWAFFDRLCNVALPRQRDFRGVSDTLDGHGNFTLGLHEQLMFPEVTMTRLTKFGAWRLAS